MPRRGTAPSYGSSGHIFFEEPPQYFLQWLHQFIFLPTMYKQRYLKPHSGEIFPQKDSLNSMKSIIFTVTFIIGKDTLKSAKEGIFWWPSGKESVLQCRRLWFDSWSGSYNSQGTKIPQDAGTTKLVHCSYWSPTVNTHDARKITCAAIRPNTAK